MKKNIFIITVLFVSTLFTACDQILDLKPEDAVSKESFFSTQKDFELALNGLYSSLRSVSGNQVGKQGTYGGDLFWEVCSDVVFYKNSWTNPWYDISRGNMNPNTPGIDFVWDRAYKTINWANTIIEQLEIKKDLIDPEYAKIVDGETRFIRAIAYLRLTSLYGAVPMVDRILTPAESKLPRTAVDQITINLIIPDLNIAINNLDESPYQLKWGKATKQAAMGMKVRALIYIKDYAATAAAAEELMKYEKESRVEFVTEYGRIFANDNENNGEILFSIKYLAGGYSQGSSHSTPFGPKKIPTLSTASINGSWSTSTIAPEFIDSYYMTDGLPASQSPLYDALNPWANRGARFEKTFYIGDYTRFSNNVLFTKAMVGVNANADYVSKYPFNINKGYMNEDVKLAWQNEDESDFIIIRYTDVLLMYAEAKTELNQINDTVYEIINMVRNRAGIDPISLNKSQDELREIIRHERKLEFAFEGIRYFDIRRWGIAEDEFDKITSDDIYNFGSKKAFLPSNYLWPIPQTAIDVNPNLLPNNSGY
ncbi:MAG: RagB/SusD family nutrient uptake outer membrane protein [Bacteroidales bacterium]|jgi:hypothetical protein